MLKDTSQARWERAFIVPEAPPQTFTDAGGITSSFTLGERRAGVKVADQRGPSLGTALRHRVTGAG